MNIEPEKWTDKSIISRSANLWAVQFPENCNNRFYDDVSVVNTFRFVFSCIFNKKIPLLEDKVFVHGKGEYRFILYSKK